MLEPDNAESNQIETQLGAAQHRMVAFDNAAFFELSHTPKTGRRRNSDSLGQFDIRHAAIGLQFPQNFQIDAIEFYADHGTAFLSLSRKHPLQNSAISATKFRIRDGLLHRSLKTCWKRMADLEYPHGTILNE